MRFVTWFLVLATWLALSAFVLPHSAFTQATTWTVAVLILALALLAPARPAARYGVSVLAVVLAGIALLAPGISGVAAIHNALVAALLFALSLVNPALKARAATVGGA
jgi:hypothetical protein